MSLKCFVCHKQMIDDRGAILISTDGDFACSVRCEMEYTKNRDSFFNNIVHSEKRTAAWLHGASIEEAMTYPENTPVTHSEKIVARLDAIQGE